MSQCVRFVHAGPILSRVLMDHGLFVFSFSIKWQGPFACTIIRFDGIIICMEFHF